MSVKPRIFFILLCFLWILLRASGTTYSASSLLLACSSSSRGHYGYDYDMGRSFFIASGCKGGRDNIARRSGNSRVALSLACPSLDIYGLQVAGGGGMHITGRVAGYVFFASATASGEKNMVSCAWGVGSRAFACAWEYA